MEMPSLFQLGDINNEQQSIESNPNNVDEGRWEQIERSVKVDPNLHQDKASELW
jgi:hypothetical protein